jgi:hypothetical protein
MPGSFDAVKLLIDAGGNLGGRDPSFDGTPPGRAEYLQRSGQMTNRHVKNSNGSPGTSGKKQAQVILPH